jgi:hypothetical protein
LEVLSIVVMVADAVVDDDDFEVADDVVDFSTATTLK